MAASNVVAITPKINFCLKVTNISKLNEIWSPEYSVQRIPWKVKVCKKVSEGTENLDLYLYCVKKEKPENWSHAAFATFKLLPFNVDIDPVVYNVEPYLFDSSGLGIGQSSFIRWDNLFDKEKCYVKNDTINLDISIEAAEPDEGAKSKLKIEHIIESGCGDGCVTTFRLSVTNIESLMAVRSTTFNMRKLLWDFSVFKSRSSILSVRLESKITGQKVSFTVEARVKLISSKGDEKSNEIIRNKSYESSNEIFSFQMISWDELFKPENGFVNNNSINMEVKIKIHSPQESNQNGELTNLKVVAKPRQMGCSICFDAFGDQEISSTICGHLFCKKCITESIEDRENCPLCNAIVSANDLRPIYLPFTN